MKWFLSDPHVEHAKVLVGPRGDAFQDIKVWRDHIHAEIDRCVAKNDDLFLLGDIVGHDNKRALSRFRNRIPRGKIWLIRGNHDPKEAACREIFGNNFRHVHMTKICGVDTWLSHYAHAFWPQSHYGSYHVYGHCVDKETEVLTDNGWRTHSTVQVGDELPTFNPMKGKLETDTISMVHRVRYTGDVFSLAGNSIDMRVTSDHRIVHFNSNARNYKTVAASEFFAEPHPTSFLRGCSRDRVGIPLTTELLKLLVLIAADATIKKDTGLTRSVLFKSRKLNYLRSVLSACDIPWREHRQANGATSINYYPPEILRSYRWKPLDSRVAEVNQTQFQAVLEAYSNSDGNQHAGGSGVMVYSSKKEEIDAVQAAAVQNGCGATCFTRADHGFSKRPSHQLYITAVRKPTKMTKVGMTNALTKTHVVDEMFWCVTTKNGNFLCRRNGKVHLTGNCHSMREDTLDEWMPERRSMEVCPEVIHKLTGEWRPINEEEIHSVLSKRRGHDPVEFYRNLYAFNKNPEEE